MDHPFKVGGWGTNRNGDYEVVQINEERGTMIIRYLESGEEYEANIATQARIRQNIDWDDAQRRQEKAAAEARYLQGYGRDFAGLAPADFKSNTEGTTWRSRSSLAGRVAKLLSAAATNPSYTFVSWAIYGWPVAFLTHRENYEIAAYEMGVRKAKFTIELDAQNAHYGFFIERSKGPMDHTWDWLQFWKALHERPVLQEQITTLEREHGVHFLGRCYAGDDTFHFADGVERGAQWLWDAQNPAALGVGERLQLLAERPEGEWVEFYLMASTPKAEAVQTGVHIAQTMAEVMKAMLPIYMAAVQG